MMTKVPIQHVERQGVFHKIWLTAVKSIRSNSESQQITKSYYIK